MAGPLLRPKYDRKIAGVCAAFARAYGWDLNLVRLVLVLLVFFGGGGVLAYVICWIVIPEEPVGNPYPAATPYGGPPSQYPPYTSAPPNPPYTSAPQTPYPPSDQPPTA